MLHCSVVCSELYTAGLHMEGGGHIILWVAKWLLVLPVALHHTPQGYTYWLLATGF